MIQQVIFNFEAKQDNRQSKSNSQHSIQNKIDYNEDGIEEGPTYNLLPLSQIGKLFFQQNKVQTQSTAPDEQIFNEAQNQQVELEFQPRQKQQSMQYSDEISKNSPNTLIQQQQLEQESINQQTNSNNNTINSLQSEKLKFLRLKNKRASTHAITKQEKFSESQQLSQNSSKFLLYFHDDDAKKKSLNKLKDIAPPQPPTNQEGIITSPRKTDKKKKGKPYEIFFRSNQFFEFFFYNFLFYMCFGPLTPFILKIIFRQNLILSRNLGFLGISYDEIKQNMYYFMWVASIVLYNYVKEFQYSNILLYELSLLMTIKVLFHCIKFGYFHPQLIMKFKEKLIDKQEKSKFVIFQHWMMQSEEMIDQELENAKARQEIEASTFYFEFIVKPSEEKLKPLFCTERNQNIKFQDDSKLDLQKLPYGMNLAKELIRYFNQKQKYFWVFRLAAAISFFRNIISRFFILPDPDILYYLEKDTFITTLYLFITTYLSFWLWFSVFSFLIIFVHDLQRKLFLMNQLSQLISPKKVDNEENHTKIYPTLTLTCAITMQTWGRLRRLLLDYGQIFTIRLSRMISTILMFYSIGLIMSILSVFGIIPNCFNFSMRILIKMGIDLFLIMIFLVKSILIGAKINESFKIHKLLLFKNKIIFDEISYNFESFQSGVVMPTNPLYKKLIQSLQDIQKLFNLNQQLTEQYIKGIQRLFTIQLQELDLFERHSPFKVLSIAMTNDLAIKILVSFCSLVGTLCISYYSKMYQ